VRKPSYRSGRLGLFMEGQSVVFPNEAYVLSVGLADFGDGGIDPSAEGALEVGPEYDRDQRILGPLDGVVFHHRNTPHRGVLFTFGRLLLVRSGLVFYVLLRHA